MHSAHALPQQSHQGRKERGERTCTEPVPFVPARHFRTYGMTMITGAIRNNTHFTKKTEPARGSRENEKDETQGQMIFRRKMPLVTLVRKARKDEEGQGTAQAEPDKGCKDQQELLQLSQPEREDQRKNSVRSKTGKLVAMGEQKSQLCLYREQQRSFRVSHT